MSSGRERDVDERLADWVDGRMTERERERFTAELRVNAQLRRDLEQYERTVGVLRAALRAPTNPTPMADRVLAAIASGGARPATARRSLTWPHAWWSFACAAAVLAAVLWIDRWSAADPATSLVATHDDPHDDAQPTLTPPPAGSVGRADAVPPSGGDGKRRELDGDPAGKKSETIDKGEKGDPDDARSPAGGLEDKARRAEPEKAAVAAGATTAPFATSPTSVPMTGAVLEPGGQPSTVVSTDPRDESKRAAQPAESGEPPTDRGRSPAGSPMPTQTPTPGAKRDVHNDGERAAAGVDPGGAQASSAKPGREERDGERAIPEPEPVLAIVELTGVASLREPADAARPTATDPGAGAPAGPTSGSPRSRGASSPATGSPATGGPATGGPAGGSGAPERPAPSTAPKADAPRDDAADARSNEAAKETGSTAGTHGAPTLADEPRLDEAALRGALDAFVARAVGAAEPPAAGRWRTARGELHASPLLPPAGAGQPAADDFFLGTGEAVREWLVEGDRADVEAMLASAGALARGGRWTLRTGEARAQELFARRALAPIDPGAPGEPTLQQRPAGERKDLRQRDGESRDKSTGAAPDAPSTAGDAGVREQAASAPQRSAAGGGGAPDGRVRVLLRVRLRAR